jgi:hypothetical protein
MGFFPRLMTSLVSFLSVICICDFSVFCSSCSSINFLPLSSLYTVYWIIPSLRSHADLYIAVDFYIIKQRYIFTTSHLTHHLSSESVSGSPSILLYNIDGQSFVILLLFFLLVSLLFVFVVYVQLHLLFFFCSRTIGLFFLFSCFLINK